MKLLAIRIGQCAERDSPLGPWTSAIAKRRVEGPVLATKMGLAGDEQADRKNHGGADKAILAYCAEHYQMWSGELDADIGQGTLGENLEISGQTEDDVCIGDTYRIGTALLQVSQPRQPCWKPAELHGIPNLTQQIATKDRTGWYLRVLTEGVISAPCPVELLERLHPEWTVGRANRLIYLNAEGSESRGELAGLPELSAAWRQMLAAPSR